MINRKDVLPSAKMRKIVLLALISTMLLSTIVIVPLQTPIQTTSTKQSCLLGEQLLSLTQSLPEPVKTHVSRLAHTMLENEGLSSESCLVFPSQEWSANITVGRAEYVFLMVDKNFAPVRSKWNVTDLITPPPMEPVYYTADSMYVIEYRINIEEGTDPGNVTLTDVWKRRIIWGNGADIRKSYYLIDYTTNIPGAGPDSYDPKTGLLSVTFDPEPGPSSYYIQFLLLAKRGYVNQFSRKPRVSYEITPKTKPQLAEGTFYDMRLSMRRFRVRGLPLYNIVMMEVPSWQSTENGVYIKNMNPQVMCSRLWWGADPPDIPGPASGGGEWIHFALSVNQEFPEHWIQIAFEKSAVTPAPGWGNFLYRGDIYMIYANKGFGIVASDSPQLTLTSDDWDISVTTGLLGEAFSVLEYYFEEPKPTTIQLF